MQCINHTIHPSMCLSKAGVVHVLAAGTSTSVQPFVHPLDDSSMHTLTDRKDQGRPASRGVSVCCAIAAAQKGAAGGTHTHTQRTPPNPTTLTGRTCLQRTTTIQVDGRLRWHRSSLICLCKVLSERPKPWTEWKRSAPSEIWGGVPSIHPPVDTHTHTHTDRQAGRQP
mmetsp:Transcript_9240/g.26659  ORF Transcript_9240/g.26659 Transcript_9240/m.26659 type:complete len:169 (-) Transcript_9240:183-689(-)